MNSTLLSALTGTAAVGTATVGGVLYAFSTFVMPALRSLPPAEAAAAMQRINVAAVRPGLMVAMFGTAAVCVAVGVGVLTTGVSRRSVALVAGSALYLVGTIGVTMAYHVPLNNALAATDPTDPGTVTLWRDYLRRWTAGNHVRAAAGLLAAAALVWGLARDE